MSDYKDLVEIVLPEGTLEYFECVKAEKNDKQINITLEEKYVIPEIPPGCERRRITSKGFSNLWVEDFPIRGRKVTLLIRRRIWRFEGIDSLLKREIPIIFPGTKLEKEFAGFLKR